MAAMEDRQKAQAAAERARKVAAGAEDPGTAEDAGGAGGVSSSAHEAAPGSRHAPAERTATSAAPHAASAGGESQSNKSEVRQNSLPLCLLLHCRVVACMCMTRSCHPSRRSPGRPSMWTLSSSAPLMVPRAPSARPQRAQLPQMQTQRTSGPRVGGHALASRIMASRSNERCHLAAFRLDGCACGVSTEGKVREEVKEVKEERKTEVKHEEAHKAPDTEKAPNGVPAAAAADAKAPPRSSAMPTLPARPGGRSAMPSLPSRPARPAAPASAEGGRASLFSLPAVEIQPAFLHAPCRNLSPCWCCVLCSHDTSWSLPCAGAPPSAPSAGPSLPARPSPPAKPEAPAAPAQPSPKPQDAQPQQPTGSSSLEWGRREGAAAPAQGPTANGTAASRTQGASANGPSANGGGASRTTTTLATANGNSGDSGHNSGAGTAAQAVNPERNLKKWPGRCWCCVQVLHVARLVFEHQDCCY